MAYNKQFTKQRHRYIYPLDEKKDINGEGHIIAIGSDITFCGLEISKLGKRKYLKRFAPDINLCQNCSDLFKKQLKEKYNLPDW